MSRFSFLPTSQEQQRKQREEHYRKQAGADESSPVDRDLTKGSPGLSVHFAVPWCASAHRGMWHLRFGSIPTTPVDSVWVRTRRHLALPSVEGSQGFPFLTLGHVEVIEGATKLRRDLVEHVGWNLQVEMCIA